VLVTSAFALLEVAAAQAGQDGTALAWVVPAPALLPGGGTAALGPSRAPGAVAPVALTVPAAGVGSEVDPVGLDPRGEIEPPPRWLVPGWYSGGPAPGESGPAVIFGHVDSPDGPAVFARLGEVRRGDRVEIARADGSTAVFTVDRSLSVPQQGFPTAEVYGPTPDAQLRLITCDGDYDRAAGRYRHNLVVFATLAKI